MSRPAYGVAAVPFRMDSPFCPSVLGFDAEHSLAAGLGPLVEWCRGARPTGKAEESYRELQGWGLLR